jgi:uncharacterized cupredoxin-like copper-binding protein
MRSFNPIIAVLCAALAAVAIAACGSSGSSSSSSSSSTASSTTPPRTTTASTTVPTTTTSTTPASPPSARLSLTETEFRITPSTPAVARTGTIAISVHNHGTVIHALAIEGPGGLVRTADIPPGGSATLTVHVTRAGRYAFFCPIDGHIRLGMHGVLIVGHPSAGPSGPPATTPTSPNSGGGIYH